MAPPARSTGARTSRVAAGLFLAAVGWYLPFAAASTVLLPARLAGLEPDGKALALGAVTGTAAVVALVSNIVFGRASDRTRSRFGRRTPWIAGGGAAAGLALWGASTAGSALAVGVWWSVFSLGVNAMLAPLLAVAALAFVLVAPDRPAGAPDGGPCWSRRGPACRCWPRPSPASSSSWASLRSVMAATRPSTPR